MISDSDIFAEYNWEIRAGGRMLLYLGPHVNESLSPAAVRELVRRKHAWAAFWNYGWDREDGPWYAYVCDTLGYDLDKITSKNSRKTIRRSLERCVVRRIEPTWLAQHGYQTYYNACSRYTNYDVQDARTFESENAVAGGLSRGRAYTASSWTRRWQPTASHTTSPRVSDSARRSSILSTRMPSRCTLSTTPWRMTASTTVSHISTPAGGHSSTTPRSRNSFRRMGWRHAPCHVGLYLTWRLRLILPVARLLRKPLLKLLPTRHQIALNALLVAYETASASRE